MEQRRDLFELLLKRVSQTAAEHGDKPPQAFGRWFTEIYFGQPNEILVSDGSGDGKADVFTSAKKGHSTRHHILNCKFTQTYDSPSPVSFYDEITRFWQAFENKANRHDYLTNVVRPSLRNKYKAAFRHYDDGLLDLFFITNHKINLGQWNSVKNYGIRTFHLDDVLQYLVEHMEGAMPETDPLVLSDITTVLNPPPQETEVPTSVVFARLIDFIRYMDEDPLDLLFARNVRLWLRETETNKGIAETFKKRPREFAYSNNGITLLCRAQNFVPGRRELTLENPRVVNGSQTLHSVRQLENPSSSARVMVRIIEIPSDKGSDISGQRAKRRDVIHQISIRSNMQNPIRKWNLVSNDDYQNELSRFFWKKKLYYEKRQNEWKDRRDDLRAIGIQRGPEIRRLMQLIASFYYQERELGPANAQGKLNELFSESNYSLIRETRPEIVYRIYLLGAAVQFRLTGLSYRRRYSDLAEYIKFALFGYVCRVVNKVDPDYWDSDAFEKFLENDLHADRPKWKRFVKSCVDHIVATYRVTQREKERDGYFLSPANFFKSPSHVRALLDASLPRKITQLGRKAFEH